MVSKPALTESSGTVIEPQRQGFAGQRQRDDHVYVAVFVHIARGQVDKNLAGNERKRASRAARKGDGDVASGSLVRQGYRS
jgi:hypothetical protein